MSYLEQNQQKLNDIIFEGRNKVYGAYELRSSYGLTVLKSISIMLSGLGTLSLTLFYAVHREDVKEIFSVPDIRDSVYVIPFRAMEPEIEPLPEPPPQKAPEQLRSDAVTSTVIRDSVATETKGVLNESVTVSNAAATGTTETAAKTTTLSGTGITATVAIKKDYEVDSGPDFEGGLKALARFIANNVRYPLPARDADKSATVYVRFVVDENGAVTDVVALNTPGFGLEEEAVRVVKLLPDFKTPARVKGEAVKVYFQLPIRFTIK
jgi:periplasmic protein TonB